MISDETRALALRTINMQMVAVWLMLLILATMQVFVLGSMHELLAFNADTIDVLNTAYTWLGYIILFQILWHAFGYFAVVFAYNRLRGESQ